MTNRIHYAWIVALVTFGVLLVTAGVRATPGVLMLSLEGEFGWSRTAISAAVAINIALFGLIGPFAASVMDRWGLRRVVLGAVALLAVSVALTTRMQTQWQFTLLWGVLVGTGTGVTSMVLAAIIASRWFDERRGLVLHPLGGQRHRTARVLASARVAGCRTRLARAALVVSGAAAVVFGIVYFFMRDRPEDLGLLPARADSPGTPRQCASWHRRSLRHAVRSRPFWILAGTFFVCGASTNGLIGTHLIAACHDYGIAEVRSARLLAMMGIFDIIGTTASGWLTDRRPRHLLFSYCTLRGISLLFLPFTLQEGAGGLAWFAVFYGLDWIATVPPTVRLTNEAFGREKYGRDLRMDWREPPARRVDGRVRRRRDPDHAGRVPARVLDRGSAVCRRRSLVSDDRTTIVRFRQDGPGIHPSRLPPRSRKCFTSDAVLLVKSGSAES